MSRNYTVRTKIERPVSEVFNAIVSRDILKRYFTDDSSGDLEAGQRIVWNFHEHGEYPVLVNLFEVNKLIGLALNAKDWTKTEDDSYDVQVRLEFEELEGNATMLIISEQGWKSDEDGIEASYENCSGWTHMAMCLKAYLEHGIDMRWND